MRLLCGPVANCGLKLSHTTIVKL